MGAATRITWTGHTADELLDLARDCRDAKQAARVIDPPQEHPCHAAGAGRHPAPYRYRAALVRAAPGSRQAPILEVTWTTLRAQRFANTSSMIGIARSAASTN